MAGCTILAIFAQYAFPTIVFGPFFLLICAFGAWFVGNVFAVLMGLFIAVIQVQTGQAVALDDNPFVMALQFCSVLAVILMLGVARAALELEWRFARVDPLTGVLNRKAFFEAIRNETHLPGIPVLLYADVDGLKYLNDTFGHEAGDKALQDLVDRVRKAIRDTDIFARIGGDEFVIYLKVRDISSAAIVAKRVNSVVNLEGDPKLKCSIGALVTPAGSTSIDAELNQADSLMYQAKREKLGMVMAISNKDDLKRLTPLAPSTIDEGQQMAAIRGRGRDTELAA